jgi:glycosyltransferase involved in cell wall biosynthesis
MFSVVIPIFNHARYLRAAVESCLISSLVKEILLVDDGSRDASAALAGQLASVNPQRVRNLSEAIPRNLGAHHRLNQLCMEASQPWIAVLNSDDLFAPHRFNLVQELIRLHKCEFVTGSMLIVDAEGRVIGSKRGISQPEYPYPQAAGYDGALQSAELRLLLCSQNFIATTSNMLFRKSLFLQIGGFADLRYSHDWDFALRATMLGRCLWTPNFLSIYRTHSSNTIKEPSPHMDGEITRFFYRFLSDFPELEKDEGIRAALTSNRHIAPYTPALAKALRAEYLEDIGKLYHFPPDLPGRAMLNALLGIYYFSYDFVLVSLDLDELPTLHSSSRDHALIWRSVHSEAAASAPEFGMPRGRGRLMRNPRLEKAPYVTADIRNLPGWSGARIEGSDLFVGPTHKKPCVKQGPALDALAALVKGSAGKPVCLVLPIFLAVGGVERNTIEMIRELQSDYSFVVVTTERLAKAQGSLHHQLDELDVPTFDLAEVGDRAFHLNLLAVIAQIVVPDLVWICNGSPWLIEHAIALRRLFARIPIIDQQVYDSDYGWINQYDCKGIQAFDHFIAINARIREKFVRSLRIPVHRVSLIYSAVNATKLKSSRVACADIPAERPKMGLSANAPKIFAFIGRLTEQKCPLVFLDLALESLRLGSADQFVLVGDGDLRQQCKEFIVTNKLTNLVHIPFSTQTSRLLALVDGLIVTSAYEGLPIVLLESLAVGTPVMATDVGDIKLVVDDYGSGAVFPAASDAPAVRRAFAEWYSKLSGYRQRAQATQDAVLERFASATIADSYRQCFLACREVYKNALSR